MSALTSLVYNFLIIALFGVDEDLCDDTVCPGNSVCKEQADGSAQCECLEGFNGDNCDDIEDPCAPGNNECDGIRAMCVPNPASIKDYFCLCTEGYEGDGFNCTGMP